MCGIFYVNVLFDDGRSLCETFFDVSSAVVEFEDWKSCDSVLEVTLESKICLDMYKPEDDDDES